VPRDGSPPSGRWSAKPGLSGGRWALNPDFRDLLSAFSTAEVRFLVVGAHAVSFHAVPRYTKDIDLWIEPTPENAKRACGRPQDLLDAEWLEKAKRRR
jgi:hypothetical protein